MPMRQRILSGVINLDVLMHMPLFSGLTQAEKEALYKQATIYSYAKDEVLYRQGDAITRFYIICNGAVKLCHETADGCEVTNHIRTAGDTMNATAAFTPAGRVHGSNAVTIKDSVILEYSIEWLKEVVQRHSSVAGNLLSTLSARAQDLELEVKNQAYMSSQQLLACFLTKTCVSEELNPRGFRLPYSKSLIASRLRMTQETLSRTFPRLKSFGITVKNKSVSFDSLENLERNLCSHCPIAEKCHARREMQKTLQGKEIPNVRTVPPVVAQAI